MISRSDLDAYTDSHMTGFIGMEDGVCLTFDLCSLFTSFSSSARSRLKVFLDLPKKTNKQETQEKDCDYEDSVCRGVD